MKKFRLIALLVAIGSFLALSGSAQTQSIWDGNAAGNSAISRLVAGDTLVNVDTVFKVANTSAGYKDLGFQVFINKLTGTPAGKMILWASTDGITYVATDSVSYAITTPSTLIIPTFTHSAVISKTGSPFSWYAVLVTNTASTTTAQVRVRYTARKQSTVIQYQ